MSDNKTKPTSVSVKEFLTSVQDKRADEARKLIAMMRDITGKDPVMWGPSIIGFGTMHYKYDSGREGDMPQLGFSPRKAQLTVYFEGFDNYAEQLSKLGPHTLGVSCLYIKSLDRIDEKVLRDMLAQSYARTLEASSKPETVEDYVRSVPVAARNQFDELRRTVRAALPNAEEVLSYGIIGYKIDDKRARVFISGWNDHVAIYPIPKQEPLKESLKPYIKGKGTLWFALGEPLPRDLIREVVAALSAK